MKIDFYEKLFLGLTIVTLIGFTAVIGLAARRHGIHLPHPAGRVDPATLRATAPFDQPGVVEVGPGEYEVNLVAAMWQFEPYFQAAEQDIRVPTGAKVTFNLSSPDVTHGFKVKDTNINIMVIPGHVSTVSHTFDEPGEYLALCHEYCGSGHQRMYVRIVVGEPAARGGLGEPSAVERAGGTLNLTAGGDS